MIIHAISHSINSSKVIQPANSEQVFVADKPLIVFGEVQVDFPQIMYHALLCTKETGLNSFL